MYYVQFTLDYLNIYSNIVFLICKYEVMAKWVEQYENIQKNSKQAQFLTIYHNVGVYYSLGLWHSKHLVPCKSTCALLNVFLSYSKLLHCDKKKSCIDNHNVENSKERRSKKIDTEQYEISNSNKHLDLTLFTWQNKK